MSKVRHSPLRPEAAGAPLPKTRPGPFRGNMADVESAAATFVENETAQQVASQDTQVVEEQATAPTTPFEGLQSHLHDHPYDTVAWQDLINIAEDSGDLKLIGTAYDSLLKVYPNTVSQHSATPKQSKKSGNLFLDMWFWTCISALFSTRLIRTSS